MVDTSIRIWCQDNIKTRQEKCHGRHPIKDDTSERG